MWGQPRVLACPEQAQRVRRGCPSKASSTIVGRKGDVGQFLRASVSKSLSAEIHRARLTVFSALAYTREGAVRADAPQSGSDRCGLLAARRYEGRLAQLVRAPALQAGGRRFESCTAHHLAFRTATGDVVQLVRTLPCHGRGRGFESRRPRHSFQALATLASGKSGDVRGR
jgi:hypothetical protein